MLLTHQFVSNTDGDIQRMEQTFLQMLQDLPVDAFHQHLGTLCQFCEGSLGWEHHAPLVDYMEERHPAAGSVFQYCNLYGSFDALDKLAKEISFETLFQNIDIENPRPLRNEFLAAHPLLDLS